MITAKRILPPSWNYTVNQVGKTVNGVAVEIDIHLETLGMWVAQAAIKLIEIQQKRLADLFHTEPMDMICSVYRAHGNGAEHFGWDNMIFVGHSPITGKPDVGPSAQQVTGLWICEATELYAHAKGNGWDSDWAHGEALSRFIGEAFAPGSLDSSGIQSVAGWLNTKGRPDWVSRANPSEVAPIPIGCSLAFLHFLHEPCGISLDKIAAAPGNTLEAKYTALTGKKGGYTAMMAILNKKFPPGTPVPNTMPLESPFLYKVS